MPRSSFAPRFVAPVARLRDLLALTLVLAAAGPACAQVDSGPFGAGAGAPVYQGARQAAGLQETYGTPITGNLATHPGNLQSIDQGLSNFPAGSLQGTRINAVSGRPQGNLQGMTRSVGGQTSIDLYGPTSPETMAYLGAHAYAFRNPQFRQQFKQAQGRAASAYPNAMSRGLSGGGFAGPVAAYTTGQGITNEGFRFTPQATQLLDDAGFQRSPNLDPRYLGPAPMGQAPVAQPPADGAAVGADQLGGGTGA